MQPGSKSPWSRLIAAGALLLAAASIPARAANPYQIISDRNAFRLRPVPVVEQVLPPPVTVPPPAVHLRGVTSSCRSPKAMVEIQEPGKPAVTRAMLQAGE